MRFKLISTIVVFVASVALCFVSTHMIFRRIDMMEDMSALVLEFIDVDDHASARVALAQMATQWQNARPMLEVFTPHEDLHAVTLQYVEAATNLDSGDLDDFARSMSLLKESLKHLHDHESLSWSNLF